MSISRCFLSSACFPKLAIIDRDWRLLLLVIIEYNLRTVKHFKRKLLTSLVRFFSIHHSAAIARGLFFGWWNINSNCVCVKSVVAVYVFKVQSHRSPFLCQSCCPLQWMFQRRRGGRCCLPLWFCAVTTQPQRTSRTSWSPGSSNPSVKTPYWITTPQVRLRVEEEDGTLLIHVL